MQGAFVASISCNNLWDMKLVQIEDPARYVACGDGGGLEILAGGAMVAYPDMCQIACAGCTSGDGWMTGPRADWENCPWTRDCGAGDPLLGTSAQARRDSGAARHLGGVNLGFADGHARWYDSEYILAHCEDARPFISDAVKEARDVTLLGVPLCRFENGP